MTVDDAIREFGNLSLQEQIRLLARYCYELTLAARDTYQLDTEAVADPIRLRRLNEIQHRVTSHLGALLDERTQRYPDDVIVKCIFGHNDHWLQLAFSRSLQNCRNPANGVEQ